jgi:hypothetical protein
MMRMARLTTIAMTGFRMKRSVKLLESMTEGRRGKVASGE